MSSPPPLDFRASAAPQRYSRSPSPRPYRRRSPSPRRRSRSPRRYSRSPSPRGRYGGYRRSPPRRPRRRSPPRFSEKVRSTTTALFVGNLPYHFRERDVEDVFGRCGRLRHVVVGFNKRTNQSKGYAFVEFEDRRDAEDAYERFNNHSIEGRRLRLDWDAGMDRKKEPQRSPRRSRSPHRSPPPARSPRRSLSPRSPVRNGDDNGSVEAPKPTETKSDKSPSDQ
eukprot:TRINITY_DN16164_c0_g1_i1.p1 TRINITY_DN16164_c0_g1~~TRINITY_DN16164_c0_g1_i1.p1  ORF type:complete len:224 (-),score=40.11 TRINITY_DN16164_c0_g1_i1:134-805(-)